MNDISRTVLAVTAGGAFTISAASAPSDGQQPGRNIRSCRSSGYRGRSISRGDLPIQGRSGDLEQSK